MGAAGSKLMPGLQEPAAAKPAEINQPPPQFLTKLLGETGDQQALAGPIYRPNFVQGISTLLTLQPKTHAVAAGILMKIFAGQFQPRTPSSSWSILNPRTQSRGPSPTLSPTTVKPYQLQQKPEHWQKHIIKTCSFFHLSFTHKPRTSPIRTGAIDKNLRF